MLDKEEFVKEKGTLSISADALKFLYEKEPKLSSFKARHIREGEISLKPKEKIKIHI